MIHSPSPPVCSVLPGNADHGGSQRLPHGALLLAGTSAAPADRAMRPINRPQPCLSIPTRQSQRLHETAEPIRRATDRPADRHNNPHSRILPAL